MMRSFAAIAAVLAVLTCLASASPVQAQYYTPYYYGPATYGPYGYPVTPAPAYGAPYGSNPYYRYYGTYGLTPYGNVGFYYHTYGFAPSGSRNGLPSAGVYPGTLLPSQYYSPVNPSYQLPSANPYLPYGGGYSVPTYYLGTY